MLRLYYRVGTSNGCTGSTTWRSTYLILHKLWTMRNHVNELSRWHVAQGSCRVTSIVCAQTIGICVEMAQNLELVIN